MFQAPSLKFRRGSDMAPIPSRVRSHRRSSYVNSLGGSDNGPPREIAPACQAFGLVDLCKTPSWPLPLSSIPLASPASEDSTVRRSSSLSKVYLLASFLGRLLQRAKSVLEHHGWSPSLPVSNLPTVALPDALELGQLHCDCNVQSILNIPVASALKDC